MFIKWQSSSASCRRSPLSGVPGGISATRLVWVSITSQPVSKLRVKLYLLVLIRLANEVLDYLFQAKAARCGEA
jgi:hypothetical protein